MFSIFYQILSDNINQNTHTRVMAPGETLPSLILIFSHVMYSNVSNQTGDYLVFLE